MTTEPQVVHDSADTREAPKPDARPPPAPKRRYGAVFGRSGNGARTIMTPARRFGPPAGSVDLCALNYTDRADWEKGSRIQDVAASIDSAVAELADFVAESLGLHLRAQRDAFEKKIANLGERLTVIEGDNRVLRAECGGLKREITLLGQRLDPRVGLGHKAPAKAPKSPSALAD
jgi:hypothetical protein